MAVATYVVLHSFVYGYFVCTFCTISKCTVVHSYMHWAYRWDSLQQEGACLGISEGRGSAAAAVAYLNDSPLCYSLMSKLTILKQF